MFENLVPLFASLISHKVQYLVIGGVASIAYGVPRMTLDVDILIRPTLDNARALLAAFEEAGMGTATLIGPEEMLSHEVTIFQDRLRVDVQTSTPGIDFDQANARYKVLTVQGVELRLVSLEDLIASKRAAGRPQDLEDLRLLELIAQDARDDAVHGTVEVHGAPV